MVVGAKTDQLALREKMGSRGIKTIFPYSAIASASMLWYIPAACNYDRC